MSINTVISGIPINNPVIPWRNKVINGQFDIWHKAATSRTGITANTWITDRWVAWMYADGGTITCNWSRQTFDLGQTSVPDDPKYFLRWQGYISGGTNTICSPRHYIEDVRSFVGKTVCLSFWAKGSIEGNIRASFWQYFGSGGSGNVFINAEPVYLTTGWRKYKLYFDVPSISGKTLGAGHGLLLDFWTNCTGTFVSSYGVGEAVNYTGTVDITNIQAEECSSVVPVSQSRLWDETSDFGSDSVSAYLDNAIKNRHQGCYDGSSADSTHYPDSAETLNNWTETLSGGSTSSVTFSNGHWYMTVKDENSTSKIFKYLHPTASNILKNTVFRGYTSTKLMSLETINGQYSSAMFGYFNTGSVTYNNSICALYQRFNPHVSGKYHLTVYTVDSVGGVDFVVMTAQLSDTSEYWVSFSGSGTQIYFDIYSTRALCEAAGTGDIERATINVTDIAGTITCNAFGVINTANSGHTSTAVVDYGIWNDNKSNWYADCNANAIDTLFNGKAKISASSFDVTETGTGTFLYDVRLKSGSVWTTHDNSGNHYTKAQVITFLQGIASNYYTGIGFIGYLDTDGANLMSMDDFSIDYTEYPELCLFEKRPIGIELQMCQRYFEKSYNANTVPGAAVPAANYDFHKCQCGNNGPNLMVKTIQFCVNKRANPVLTYWDNANHANKATYYSATESFRQNNTVLSSITYSEHDVKAWGYNGITNGYGGFGMGWQVDCDI